MPVHQVVILIQLVAQLEKEILYGQWSLKQIAVQIRDGLAGHLDPGQGLETDDITGGDDHSKETTVILTLDMVEVGFHAVGHPTVDEIGRVREIHQCITDDEAEKEAENVLNRWQQGWEGLLTNMLAGVHDLQHQQTVIDNIRMTWSLKTLYYGKMMIL